MLWNICKKIESENTKNSKYLIELKDHSLIEIGCIIHNGYTHLCISTQIGCPIHCTHCATTYSDFKFSRNITLDELTSIIAYFYEQVKLLGYPIIISFSGHGEPLLNWKSVCYVSNLYSELVNDIYLTTVCIKRIMPFVMKQNSIKIFISLHGTTDSERHKLVPSIKKIALINDIVQFTKSYLSKGGRVVWNYMMTKNNITEESASNLCKLVDLINENLEIRFTKYIDIGIATTIANPSDDNIRTFFSILEHYRSIYNSTWEYRISNIEGDDIKVACGQMSASRL